MRNLAQETSKETPIRSILVAATLSLFLAACGGGGGSSDSPPVTNSGGGNGSGGGGSPTGGSGGGPTGGSGGGPTGGSGGGPTGGSGGGGSGSTSSGTPVTSWGTGARGNSDNSFSVNSYGSSFSYHVQGTPTMVDAAHQEAVRNGGDKATYTGTYEGMYQLYKGAIAEDGTLVEDDWGEALEDTGLLGITVDLQKFSGEGVVTVQLDSNHDVNEDTLPDEMAGGLGGFLEFSADLQADASGPAAFETDEPGDGSTGDPVTGIYKKLLGALFGSRGQWAGGVYEFEKFDNIRGAGWFGGKQLGEANWPGEADTTGTGGEVVKWGPWAERPKGFTVGNDEGRFQSTELLDQQTGCMEVDGCPLRYYIAGTLTDDAVIQAMTGTATWTGTYNGKYQIINDPDGNPFTDPDDSQWSPFMDDNGTARMVMTFGHITSRAEFELTLTSANGNTFFSSREESMNLGNSRVPDWRHRDEYTNTVTIPGNTNIGAHNRFSSDVSQLRALSGLSTAASGGFFGPDAEHIVGTYVYGLHAHPTIAGAGTFSGTKQ